ncbi:MAG TPA: histidine kinase [Parafilimonas sp.]|nr:histidine kinase [Parafilimonas sp.]
MSLKTIKINDIRIRIVLHISFWLLSYFVFLQVFKTGVTAEKIDYIYTCLFQASVIPAVYINLIFLLPTLEKKRHWNRYLSSVIFLIIIFSLLNYSFFKTWSNIILPDYFFISYFHYWQVVLFFVAYLSITSLLKLSKSWFAVNELKKELLIAEKQKAELELKALRAQMNPHFIFNCMNSIKALIQQDEKDKAADYLTTFSKLIRTIFHNSDKKEVTLYDEIETCRLYTQLESMRSSNKFSYEFAVDETLDLKSVMVPALILQPFIENAIWHGIMPKKDGGRLTIKIGKTDHNINCIIDDDGIGRDVSMLNKSSSNHYIHQSKGVRLTQTRLELSNVLNQRNATVEIIDKTDSMNAPAGTKVILVFNQE